MSHTTRFIVLPGDIPAEVAWSGSTGWYGEKGGILPPRDQRPCSMGAYAPGKVGMPSPPKELEAQKQKRRRQRTVAERKDERERAMARALGTLGHRKQVL